jgi:hypothetical protein
MVPVIVLVVMPVFMVFLVSAMVVRPVIGITNNFPDQWVIEIVFNTVFVSAFVMLSMVRFSMMACCAFMWPDPTAVGECRLVGKEQGSCNA